jgi:hypothetical protein
VVAIGFSVGTAQLGAGGDDEEGMGERDEPVHFPGCDLGMFRPSIFSSS